MEHGESSLIFALRVFLPSPDELMLLRDRLNKVINKEFATHRIEIPFPRRNLHVRSGPPPWSPSTAATGASDGSRTVAE